MKTISATDARSGLYRLIDRVNEDNAPIQIAGKRSAAVLMSMEDYSSIEETLYLLNIPGMRESILEGMKTSAEECAAEVDL